MSRGTRALLGLLAALLASGCESVSLSKLGGGGGRSPETFLESDDYQDDDEIVGAFLQDSEYGLMIEDLERHDVEFDWAWVKVPSETPLKRPATLGFDLPAGATVHVLPVQNLSLKVAPGIEDAVRESLRQALGLLDLEAIDGDGADLELGVAIVDYKADKTYVYFAMADPFIELEGRLRDLRTGDTVFLFRTQEHGDTPALAAADVASDLARFLR